jgi:hypothetical protein
MFFLACHAETFSPSRTDRKWAAAISEKMRSIPEAGISSVYQFNMKHAGRSAALDVRDPEHPKVAFPGGPTFTLLDWLNFPASVPEVEAAWVDDGFLYFDEIASPKKTCVV